jgi:predicted DCC family thiol-disulfide oxidoreductase YuxK
MIKPANNRTLSVYYDGQCPFCSRYMQLYRLRQGDKELVLINVRNDVATLAEVTAMGLDIDNGMVVQLDDIRYAATNTRLCPLFTTARALTSQLQHRIIA